MDMSELSAKQQTAPSMEQQATAKLFVLLNAIDSRIKQKDVKLSHVSVMEGEDAKNCIRIDLGKTPFEVRSHIEEIRPLLENITRRKVLMHPEKSYLDFHGSIEDLAKINTGLARTQLRNHVVTQNHP